MFFRGSNKADLQRCRYDCFQAQIKVTALTPHIITTVCVHSPTSGTSVVLALITSQLKCLFVLLLNLTAWNLQTPCREKLFTNRSDKRPESPTIVQLVQPHRPPARSLNPSTPPRGRQCWWASECRRFDSAAESDCHTLWWEDRLSQQASPRDSCRGRAQFRALLFLAGGLRYVTRWIH